ncbi:hypothetical protein PENSPDRAFT_615262 [Peniophora sp. CONT]|nr:hypothetical protein PENSPDRAFT_615262 [Peniophora sp. CONT]
MAVITKKSLLSDEPTNIVHQPITIGHVQLRDLIICPEERGVVNYVHDRAIVERDIRDPLSSQRTLAALNFIPNTIASHILPDTEECMLAAGGQESELHLSLYSRNDGSSAGTRRLWRSDSVLPGSINNSILLTTLSLTRSNQSALEPRIVVSNNDHTCKFFDVNIRGTSSSSRLTQSGMLKLDSPVNHSSISPDGRTLLSVGDSPNVHLHALNGGARITFDPIAQLPMPTPDSPDSTSYSGGPASFSSAFSSCGTKFAVASQDGMCAVWDVRSSKPLRVFHTDRTSESWYDDTWDLTRPGGKAPGWGVRNVKFSPAGRSGKEVLTFTEHTSLLHVIDASTFEQHDIVSVPALMPANSTPQPSAPQPGAESSWTSPTMLTPRPAPRVHLAGPEYPGHLTSSPAHTMATSSARAAYLRRQSTRFDDDASLLVHVPPLGDRGAERDVRTVLGRHGVRTVAGDESEHLLGHGYDLGLDVEMEVEEEDLHEDNDAMSECASRVPSRAASPSPTPWRWTMAPEYTPAPERASCPATSSFTLVTPRHLDIAGTCFDPEGKHVYVGTKTGIVEWSVRGADKVWYSGSSWA